MTETDADEQNVELTPLFEKTVLHKKDILEISSQLRRESITKWWILICLLVISSAIFHCQYSIGALEDDIMTFYDLDNTEFALLTTVVYFFAVVASLCGPAIVHRFGLYILSIWSQTCLVISQVFVCLSFSNDLIALLYIGRILTGVSLGWNYIVANSTIGIWFNGSKWQAFAFIASQNSIECGILAARYILVPIRNDADDDLTAPFYFSLAFAICSFIASVAMYCFEDVFVYQYIIPHASRYIISGSLSHSGSANGSPNASDEHEPIITSDVIDTEQIDNSNNNNNYNTIDATSVNDASASEVDDAQTITAIRAHLHDITSTSQDEYFSRVKTFTTSIWLMIGICCVGTACVGIFDNEMEEPLQKKFGLSEWMSNFEISLTIIIGLLLGGFFAIGISKIGYYIYWILATYVFMTVGTLVLAVGADKTYIPWVGLIICAFGNDFFFTSSFTSFYLILPIQDISVATSLTCILSYSFTTIGIYVFGVLADDYNYSVAITFIAICSGVGVVLSLILFVLDIKQKGPLHQPPKHKD